MQDYLAQGHSSSDICKMMHTTYRQVRKFSSGDPDILCRGPSSGSLRNSILDQYLSFILEQLNLGIKIKHIHKFLLEMGHKGKLTNLYDYCKKVIEKNAINYYTNKNINWVTYNKEKIQCYYIQRNNLLEHLWSGKGVTDVFVNAKVDHQCLSNC